LPSRRCATAKPDTKFMRVVCTVWFLKHKYLRADVQVKELWTNCESSQALSTIQMTVYSLTSRTFYLWSCCLQTTICVDYARITSTRDTLWLCLRCARDLQTASLVRSGLTVATVVMLVPRSKN
jgi:hypothetical protein